MDADLSKSGAAGVETGFSKSSRARRRRKNKKNKQEGHDDGANTADDLASPTSPTQPNPPLSAALSNGQRVGNDHDNAHPPPPPPPGSTEEGAQRKSHHHRHRHRNHRSATENDGASETPAAKPLPIEPVEGEKVDETPPPAPAPAVPAAEASPEKLDDAAQPAAEKSKAQLRAERRAKQEAQRAAKAERLQASGKAPPPSRTKEGGEAGGKGKQAPQKPKEGKEEKPQTAAAAAGAAGGGVAPRTPRKSEGGGDETDGRVVMRVPAELRHDDPQQVKKKMKRLEKQKLPARPEVHKKVSLFSHLPQYQIEGGVLPKTWKAGNSTVHSAFYRVGVQMAHGNIRGANNRCLALAEALSTFIDSYKRTEDKEFARHFESVLSPNITFLSECRPLTAGMRTFVKHFKAEVVSVGRKEDLTDDQKKCQLKEMAYNFIREKIILAGETIAENASEKITDKCCLLTYAYSSTVCSVFAHAKKQGTNFTVIVADSEPLFEGRRMIKFLEKHGIDCEYVSLTGVYSIMKRVTGVFIGAQALFSNGSVLSRAGTGFVACIAEQFNCLVNVCCESYKFWERVQLDSFVYNDLSDPSILIDDSKMREEWENPKSPLHYVNPQYDVTPPELIDVVITELCLMPGSSVPVVLRRNAV